MNIVQTVMSMKVGAIGASWGTISIRRQHQHNSVSHAQEIVNLAMMHSHAMNVRLKVICTIQRTQTQMDASVMKNSVGSKYKINSFRVIVLMGSWTSTAPVLHAINCLQAVQPVYLNKNQPKTRFMLESMIICLVNYLTWNVKNATV